MILRKRTFARKMKRLGACQNGITRLLESDLGVEEYIRRFFVMVIVRPASAGYQFERGCSDIHWLYDRIDYATTPMWANPNLLTVDQFIEKIRNRFGEKR